MKESSSTRPAESGQTVLRTNNSLPVWLWVCLGAWAISFYLPAANIGLAGTRSAATGWTIVHDSLVLLVVPVKGMWFGVFPPVWAVFLNVFMVMLPLQIKRVERGEGRMFAMLFALGTAVPVVLAYIPPSLGAMGLGFPLLIGFYVWELSMIVAAALFMRALWGDNWGYAPATALIGLLICLPIRRGEWNFEPERPKPSAVAPSLSGRPLPDVVQPTTMIFESEPNPSFVGEPVTFSAAISVPLGPVPSGTVTFTDVAAHELIEKMHTTSGSVTVSTDSLSVGKHAIHANFVPDAGDRYLSSDWSSVQIVNKGNSKTVEHF